MAETRFTSDHFRKVLGHYPTGVSVITAAADGRAAAMVVGTFTSVSLDPPLVGFLPDKGSTSWPRIHESGRFCVNVLAADDAAVCKQMSAKGADKFSSVGYRLSGNGSPILDCALAWIDCDIVSISETGDHFFVLGAVRELETQRQTEPMIFLGGKFGRFAAQDA